MHDVAGFAASDAGGTIAKPDGHPYLRLTRVLEPGMVVTIEPGIYFIDMLLDEAEGATATPTASTGRAWTRSSRSAASASRTMWCCTEAAPVNLTREGFAEARDRLSVIALTARAGTAMRGGQAAWLRRQRP